MYLAPPLAPQSLHVAKETSSSITVEWSEPSDDGGEPIRAYIIDVKGPNDREFENVAKISGKDLSYTVGELSSNTEYEIEVKAENIAGESADVAVLETPAKTKAKASEFVCLIVTSKVFHFFVSFIATHVF